MNVSLREVLCTRGFYDFLAQWMIFDLLRQKLFPLGLPIEDERMEYAVLPDLPIHSFKNNASNIHDNDPTTLPNTRISHQPNNNQCKDPYDPWFHQGQQS